MGFYAENAPNVLNCSCCCYFKHALARTVFRGQSSGLLVFQETYKPFQSTHGTIQARLTAARSGILLCFLLQPRSHGVFRHAVLGLARVGVANAIFPKSVFEF